MLMINGSLMAFLLPLLRSRQGRPTPANQPRYCGSSSGQIQVRSARVNTQLCWPLVISSSSSSSSTPFLYLGILFAFLSLYFDYFLRRPFVVFCCCIFWIYFLAGGCWGREGGCELAPLCFECPDIYISKPKVRSFLLLHRFVSPVFFCHPTVSYLSPHAVARCYLSSLPPCCHVLPGVCATLLPRVAYLFCHPVVMCCLSSLPPGCHVLPILSAALLPRIAYLFCHPVATCCLSFLPPCCHVLLILSATRLPRVAYPICHPVATYCLSFLPPCCHVVPILSATLLPRGARRFCHPVVMCCLSYLPPCCHVLPILSATLLPHVPQLPLPPCCQAYPDFCVAKGILTSAVLLPL